MSRRIFISALFILVTLISCERRPLVELYNTHYVRVYIDENLLNVTEGFYNPEHQKPAYKSPSIIRIALTDRNNGNVVSERYLRNIGEDERGKYYDGYIVANPGVYNLMAYNFDTESSIMTGVGNHFTTTSTTNEIASHLYSKIPSRAKSPVPNESIVYDPDHVFVVDCGDVVVPYVEELDTLRTPDGDYFFGESVVKSYYLQIGIQGMEYVSSSVALLNGMSGSAMVHGRCMNPDHEVTVYFEMIKSHLDMDEDGRALIYATFNTYGKLPDADSELEITFDLLTTYGSHHTEKFDISKEFETRDAIEHQWIIIDKTIVVPDPPKVESDGGFLPEVGPWDDVNTDIII